jgi:hypothetical protein
MGLRVGLRQVTGNLRLIDSFGQKGKGLRVVVAGLDCERREVDRAAVEPARRPRLESPQLESQFD